MKKKLLSRILVGMLVVSMTATSGGLSTISVSAATNIATENIQRVMVHDPSIFKDTDGTYYVFGSHMATAKSTDLVNWTQISSDYQFANSGNDPVYGNVKENLADSFKWAGYDDGDCAGGKFAVWAPDVIYNEEYDWGDGTYGAYMMYYTASSTWRRSCIGLAVTKSLNEPFKAVDTLVYSGMTETGDFDGNSTRDTKWSNDYLNFNELIAKGSANGGIDEVNPKWFMNGGKEYNIGYAPNCIDPGIVETPDGKIWMSYGSWSAGIFMLEIDPKTGLAIYPGKDSGDPATGVYTDRYYGIHIAGGNPDSSNTVSGEAPYIRYDANSGYYYLYITYGGLLTNGGYSMRLFRSKNVTGPYEDASGKLANASFKDIKNYGVKLIGNYGFMGQGTEYFAAGHNSAFVEGENHYLISHQRFNDGTEYHEVRVRQQFLNEDDWLVTAVYENKNEQISTYAEDEVIGNYEFVNHGLGEKDGSLIINQMVDLTADHKVTMSEQEVGTWEMKASDRGYNYVTITINDVVYKGVFFKQTKDTNEETMTFTAIGNNNESIWGSKLDLTDEVRAELAKDELTKTMPTLINEDIELPKTVKNANITWLSSNPQVLSATGKVNRRMVDTDVVLTAVVTYGQASIPVDFTIKVASISQPIYSFDFENVSKGIVYAKGDSVKTGVATLRGTAKVVSDEKRGHVLQIVGEGEARDQNFLQMPSDTFSTVTEKGYTVSMWVNVGTGNWEHSALFEAKSSDVQRIDKYPMTRIGGNLIARINANGYNDTRADWSVLPETGWHHVVYSVNTKGNIVWVDGQLFHNLPKDLTGCFDVTNDFSIQKADDVRVGSGSIWKDKDINNAMFDDVTVYDGTLTKDEVVNLYESTKQGGSVNVGGSGIGGGSGSGSASTGGTTVQKPTGDKPADNNNASENQNGVNNSTVEKTPLGTVADNMVATVVVEKNGNGTVTATTVDVTATIDSNKTSISAETISQLKKEAGSDAVISLTAVDTTGDSLYKVNVEASKLTAGNKLYIYKVDEKTGEYVMVNSKAYTVAKDGSFSISINNNAEYELLTKEETKAIEKQIKASIKPKASSKEVKKGNTTKMELAKSFNVKNAKSITYTSSKGSVAKVSKSGKITTKGTGTATIKAKVTLKNGSTKTVSMKVKVK